MKIQITLDTAWLSGALKRLLSTRSRRGLVVLATALIPLVTWAAVTKPYVFSDGETISAAQVNQNFDTVYSAVNAVDLKIQQVACEGRRGVWSNSSNSCQEFAYYTGACAYNSCSCATGYHMCTFVDLFSGGFASLRRPGLNNAKTYGWVAGSYIGETDKFFYPWGQGSTLQCSSGSHYMIDMRRGASGYTAWGCYPDTYTDVTAMCCRNDQ